MITNLVHCTKAVVFEADVAIIGAGAMGLVLTAELFDSGLRVLLLEAGGVEPTHFNDQMLKVENVGHSFNGSDYSGRRRILGGATSLWGGQFLPLADIVFDDRPWLGVSGWPLSKEILRPYYRRAADFGSLASQEGDESIWRMHRIDPPCFDPSLLFSEFSRFSPRPNFASSLYQKLVQSANVEALLNSVVAEIILDSHGSIKELDLRSKNGVSSTARARTYVLAAGAIESARLLLASSNQDARGVGNSSGLVGRYFQDHIALSAANIFPKSREQFHLLYENFILGSTKYAPKISISDTVQQTESLLNVGGFFRFPLDRQASVESLKVFAGHIKRRTKPDDALLLARRMFASMPEIVRFVYALKAKKRIRAARKGSIFLEVHAEQLPIPESRITLSQQTDDLGIPRARINWKIDDSSRVAIRCFVDLVRHEFNRLGIADVVPFQEILGDPAAFQRSASDVYHQMGTLRMSIEPVDGVTNPDSRMHDVPNLYVAGCSLFPASGYSNPTHTGLALAIRLADKLRSEM